MSLRPHADLRLVHAGHRADDAGGFPPLILASILLELERAFGLPFFDPTRGGDPLLWQHLFWLFGHPDVYIIFLPMAGALSVMIPVFARRELVGYTMGRRRHRRHRRSSASACGCTTCSRWASRTWRWPSSRPAGIVAVPTAVQMFAWIGHAGARQAALGPADAVHRRLLLRLRAGRADRRDAGHRALRLAGARQHFVVAHLHYVLVGGLRVSAARRHVLLAAAAQRAQRVAAPGRGRPSG